MVVDRSVQTETASQAPPQSQHPRLPDSAAGSVPRLAGFLLINPRSGSGGPDAEELQTAAAAEGVEARILAKGEDPAELALKADADSLGMAGGDGSLGAIAAVAIERDLPFVCIPFGTRNHFARDIGLDRDDPLGGLAAFQHGEERRVDVGAVEGRLFLNNVSLGLYARLVHRRERHRRRREALARLRALAMLARSRRPLGLRIDGAPVEARVVLVANNDYTVEPWSIGERERLDEGVLYLYAARGLVRSTWDERRAERFTIDSSAGTLAAAVDGEPAELGTPAVFEIRPQALRLLLPPR
jgi:diacylglycerol kinase family enzyme